MLPVPNSPHLYEYSLVPSVHIQLVSLEVEHSDQASISRIMEGAGYRVYKTLTNANNPNIIQDSTYEKV